MRAIRSIGLLAVLLLSLFALTGCIKMRSHVLLNTDGSAEVAHIVAMDEAMLQMAEQQGNGGKNPFVELRRGLEKKGYNVVRYSKEGLQGVQATKHCKNMKEVGKALGEMDPAELTGEPSRFKNPSIGDISKGIKIEKSWFSTKYSLDTDIDMSMPKDALQGLGSIGDFGGDSEKAMRAQMALLNSMVNMSFAVTLPVKPKSTNAKIVADKGNTIEWPLMIGSKNHLAAEVSIPNYRNIMITAVLPLALLLFGVFRFIKRRRDSRPTMVEVPQSKDEAAG